MTAIRNGVPLIVANSSILLVKVWKQTFKTHALLSNYRDWGSLEWPDNEFNRDSFLRKNCWIQSFPPPAVFLQDFALPKLRWDIESWMKFSTIVCLLFVLRSEQSIGFSHWRLLGDYALFTRKGIVNLQNWGENFKLRFRGWFVCLFVRE